MGQYQETMEQIDIISRNLETMFQRELVDITALQDELGLAMFCFLGSSDVVGWRSPPRGVRFAKGPDLTEG